MTDSASSEARRRVGSILADPSFDDPAAEDGRDEVIWRLVGELGWEPVRDEMLAALEDDRAMRHWETAAAVVWRGVERPMPKVRVIALLRPCLLAEAPAEQQLDENLVWSITRNLKGVEYLSDYDPLDDPAVKAELMRLRTRPRPE